MKMIALLNQALEQVAARIRQVRLWAGLAVCWLVWALVGFTAWGVLLRSGFDRTQGLWTLGAIASLAALTGLAWFLVTFWSLRDRHWIARRIEAEHPDLSALLLTAIEQTPSPAGELGFLQAAVVDQALKHRRYHDWQAIVPRSHLKAAHLAHGGALLGLGVMMATLIGSLQARINPEQPAPLQGEKAIAEAPPSTKVTVEPGDTEIERGTSLLVVARFEEVVPPEATLVVEGLDGETSTRALSRSLEDPTFAGQVPSVQTDFSYHVTFGEERSPSYQVKVFEYPRLERVDAHLVYPEFAAMEPKTIEDVRYVTAVEGTELTLLLHLNKDIAKGRLVDRQDQELALVPQEEGEHVYRATLRLKESRRFRVELLDRENRQNKRTAEIVVNVTRNLPPLVKMMLPGHDSRVSPLEELSLKADLKDDYGLVRYGLSYAQAGQEPREVVLHEGKPAPKQVQPEHVIDFEALRAQPDQLVTYYFWAEDLDVDGKPRRTSGDMYFAEVRHFEEIFRQAERDPNQEERERQQRERNQQNQQQGEGNAAERADRLAELQKQIINGTWKLIRREIHATPSAEFAGDSGVLRTAQQSVLEQAGQLAEQVQDPESVEKVAEAQKFIKEAEQHLGEAAEKGSIGALQPALAAEQAAYQALLKLRAREFEVQRRNQRNQRNQRNRQSSSRNANSSRNPSQRQLRQLELSNEQNRYETQRQARAQQERQSQQEREQRDRQQRERQEMSNRLRELARRQTDLNERVKELKSALEQAKTEQERQEIQRQLKRLQEQQQQLLRDTDELRDRMERSENREEMNDARQQLEQSRERIRQASEALEKGQLSRAITEGTRAQRELNNLREDLRREAANQFSEEMRELRERARLLDEDQEKLNRQLAEWDRNPPRTLRDDRKKNVTEGLEEQRQRLEEILERMRKTVQAAEKNEPRLAQELFEGVRKATEDKVDDSLDLARRLVEEGVIKDAAEASRRSGEGIDQLRQGIDRAAENVLGGETEALRQARRELEELADQIDREIARATGRERQPGQRGERQPGERQPGERQPGERQPGQRGERQPGERQPGQRQPGERQPGERQPGERQPGQGQPGQRGERQPGERQPGERQPGERQPGQRGERQPGERQPGQRQPGEGQPGQRGERQPGERQPGERQPGERQPGQRGERQPGQRQPGERQPGQRGERQPGERQPGQRGERQPGERQPGQRQPGQRGERQPGERQPGQRQPGERQPGERQPGERQPQPGQGGGNRLDDLQRLLEAARGGPGGPIRGEDFREWYDRLRSAERLIEDPELRAEAARIRDRARGFREEYKRHSREPDWDKLQDLVAEPLQELVKRIDEEVRRREAPDSLVPIDRDPVPAEFAEGVRRYYERLGRKRP